MIRSLMCLAFGVCLFFSAQSSRADEVKRALFELGVHMDGAEGVAIDMIGEAPRLKPGAIGLMKRQLSNSIDVAEALKLPSIGLKSLLADVDAERASFADMATRMAKMRLEMQATSAATINPGAGAPFSMGVHLSGAERVALGASGFARDDKPGTGPLIERQLIRMADGAGGLGVTVKPVLDIQTNLGRGVAFADLASQLAKLRLSWQLELAAQPGFGGAVVGGGGGGGVGGGGGAKVIFSQASNLTNADPRDPTSPGKFAKVHTVQLKAGQTVVIDLESGDGNPIPNPGFFDTWLRVEDPTGREVAFSDDISPMNFNSRVEFTPAQDGNYRLVATTFQSGATGAYTLTVRQK